MVRLKAELDAQYPSQIRPPRSAATAGTLNKSEELRAAEAAARSKVAEAAASGERRGKQPRSREAAELAKAEQAARDAVLASLAQPASAGMPVYSPKRTNKPEPGKAAARAAAETLMSADPLHSSADPLQVCERKLDLRNATCDVSVC